MTHSRELRVGGTVGGLAARLSSSRALLARLAGLRSSSRRARAAQAARGEEEAHAAEAADTVRAAETARTDLAARDEALFAVHVEQALQIIGQVEAPRVVSVTDDNIRPMVRR